MADDSYRGYGNGSYGRGTGSPEPPTDPLTELARLIGQSDPFGDSSARRTNRRARTEWRDDRQPAPRYDDVGHDDRYAPSEPSHSEPSHYAQDGYATNPDGQTFAQDARYDGAGYGDAPHGYGDQAYRGEQQSYPGEQQPYPEPQPYEAEPGAYDQARPNGQPPPFLGGDPQSRPEAYFDEAPAPRRRGWLVTAAALVGLAVIGTAGAFAYRAVFAGGPPPLITRDVKPDKVVPPPAQLADNSTNKQSERLAVGDERMAPPPEQPMVIPAVPQAPGANTPPGLANQATGPLQPPAVAPAPNAAPGPNGAPGPRRIRTVKITSDQEPVEPVAPPRPIAPRTAPPRAIAPAPAPRNADAPLPLTPQGAPDAPPPAPPVAAPRNIAPGPPLRTTALAPNAPVEGTGNHGFYVQVSAQKTQEEARTSFHNIQAKYANVLGGQSPVLRRKDLGSRGIFYGAQVGPFSHEEAVQLCERLKSAGGSCMIQRN